MSACPVLLSIYSSSVRYPLVFSDVMFDLKREVISMAMVVVYFLNPRPQPGARCIGQRRASSRTPAEIGSIRSDQTGAGAACSSEHLQVIWNAFWHRLSTSIEGGDRQLGTVPGGDEPTKSCRWLRKLDRGINADG